MITICHSNTNVYVCPSCDSVFAVEKKDYKRLICPLCSESAEKLGEGEMQYYEESLQATS